MKSTDIAFGSLVFDTEQMLLWRDGEPLMLGRRAGLLLGMLLHHRGSVVGKQDLIDAAWPGEAVEESNLSVQITKLRRVIGAEWIHTIERVGYRLMAPKETETAAQRSESAFPRLAILPFLDLRGDGANLARGRGLRDELTTALVRFRTLRIIDAEAHATRDPDIRAIVSELDAHYVLAGNMRGPDRLSLRLVEGTAGTTIWAQSFVLDPQDDRAGTMAAIVESEIHYAEIVGGQRIGRPGAEAYDSYLRGRLALRSSRQDANAMAYGFFARAIELAPDQPAYLSAACEALHHRLAVGWQPLGDDHKRINLDLTRRGLDLSQNDATSLALLGNSMFTLDEEDIGLATNRRAVEMNPNDTLVLVCAGLANLWAGDIDEAEALYARARSLAPRDPVQRFAIGGLAQVNRIRGNYDAWLDYARQTLALSPGYSGGHWQTISALSHLGRHSEAERQLDRYLRISPGVTIASIEHGQHYADRTRLVPLLEGLRMAGLPER